MANFTTNDLAVRILRDLNITPIDQAPSANDIDFVLETITCEFAKMEADGIRFNNAETSVDSISPVMFIELSRRIGFAIAPGYGIMDAGTALQAIKSSEDEIRKLVAPVATPEELQIERAARGARIRDPIISQ
jgi:hypothetical protein